MLESDEGRRSSPLAAGTITRTCARPRPPAGTGYTALAGAVVLAVLVIVASSLRDWAAPAREVGGGPPVSPADPVAAAARQPIEHREVAQPTPRSAEADESIHGFVFDAETRDPLEGATVFLFKTDHPERGMRPPVTATTTTDERGRYGFPSTEIGVMSAGIVLLRRDGYCQLVVGFTEGQGLVKRRVMDACLPVDRAKVLTCVYSDGQAGSRLGVYLTAVEWRIRPGVPFEGRVGFQGDTDDAGRLSLTGCVPGRYRVGVVDRFGHDVRWSPSHVVLTATEESYEVVLDGARPQTVVEGRLTCADGGVARNVMLAARGRDGERLGRCYTLANGRFRIVSQLDSRPFELCLQAGREWRLQGTTEFSGFLEEPVELICTRPADHRIEVVDEGGAPVDNVLTRVWPVNDGCRSEGSTVWLSSKVSSESIIQIAVRDGRLCTSDLLHVEEIRRQPIRWIVLRAPRSKRVLVVGPDGLPAAGVLVRIAKTLVALDPRSGLLVTERGVFLSPVASGSLVNAGRVVHTARTDDRGEAIIEYDPKSAAQWVFLGDAYIHDTWHEIAADRFVIGEHSRVRGSLRGWSQSKKAPHRRHVRLVQMNGAHFRRAYRATVDIDGRFEFAGVLAGTYDVIVDGEWMGETPTGRDRVVVSGPTDSLVIDVAK